MPEPDGDSPLDARDWAIVFQAYEEYPILAFILAQHLDFVKALIQHSREGRELAIAGLDRAMESLMPHTIFRMPDVDFTCQQSQVSFARRTRKQFTI